MWSVSFAAIPRQISAARIPGALREAMKRDASGSRPAGAAPMGWGPRLQTDG